MSVRCKFYCSSIGQSHPADQNRTITMQAVHDPSIPEDEAFTKWTPSGELKVVINNPRALEAIKLGGYYYLDLTPVG